MKISFPTRHRQGGMAVIVMLALLSLVLLYIGTNLRTLNSLKWELKLIEQRQVRRLNAISAANATAIAVRVAGTSTVTGPAVSGSTDISSSASITAAAA